MTLYLFIINMQSEQFQDILKTPKKVLTLDYSPSHLMQRAEQLKQKLNEKYNFLQNKAQEDAQKKVINQLSSIMREWSYQVAKANGIPEENLHKFEAQLFTFGSYYLGVCSRDGDIDAIVVVPNLFDRDKHFYHELHELLKTKSNITQLKCVSSAKVPILKMMIDNVPVDLSFTKLDMQIIDHNLQLSDNQLLANLDYQSILSLNGRRVAQHIDKYSNIKMSNYRPTLQFIKLWAKNKGIYSNMMGYLGGISWAIMVAKICQMYPNYSPLDILKQFFTIYSQWSWSDTPVLIEEAIDEPNIYHNKDQYFKKPDFLKTAKIHVITPSFPCMNSTQAVTEVGLSVIKKFLNEGAAIVAEESKLQNQWIQLIGKNYLSPTIFSVISKISFKLIFYAGIRTRTILSPGWGWFRVALIFQEEIFNKLKKVIDQIRKWCIYVVTNQTFKSLSRCPFESHGVQNQIRFKFKDPIFKQSISLFYGIRVKETIKHQVQGQFNLFLPIQKFIESICKDDTYLKNKQNLDLRVFYTNQNEIKEQMEQNKSNQEEIQTTQEVPVEPVVQKKILTNRRQPVNQSLYKF